MYKQLAAALKHGLANPIKILVNMDKQIIRGAKTWYNKYSQDTGKHDQTNYPRC